MPLIPYVLLKPFLVSFLYLFLKVFWLLPVAWTAVSRSAYSLSVFCWFCRVISAHIRRRAHMLNPQVPVWVPGLSLTRQASPCLKGRGVPCSCTFRLWFWTHEGGMDWTESPEPHLPSLSWGQLPAASLCLTLLGLTRRQQGNSSLVVKDYWFHWGLSLCWYSSGVWEPGLLLSFFGL